MSSLVWRIVKLTTITLSWVTGPALANFSQLFWNTLLVFVWKMFWNKSNVLNASVQSLKQAQPNPTNSSTKKTEVAYFMPTPAFSKLLKLLSVLLKSCWLCHLEVFHLRNIYLWLCHRLFLTMLFPIIHSAFKVWKNTHWTAPPWIIINFQWSKWLSTASLKFECTTPQRWFLKEWTEPKFAKSYLN